MWGVFLEELKLWVFRLGAEMRPLGTNEWSWKEKFKLFSVIEFGVFLEDYYKRFRDEAMENIFDCFLFPPSYFHYLFLYDTSKSDCDWGWCRFLSFFLKNLSVFLFFFSNVTHTIRINSIITNDSKLRINRNKIPPIFQKPIIWYLGDKKMWRKNGKYRDLWRQDRNSGTNSGKITELGVHNLTKNQQITVE